MTFFKNPKRTKAVVTPDITLETPQKPDPLPPPSPFPPHPAPKPESK